MFVIAGNDEFIIKYNDIPDFIVDYNDKFGQTDLEFYNYGYGLIESVITTFGSFLNYCDPEIRKDIIDRLVYLQQGGKINNYKVTDENSIEILSNELNEKESIKPFRLCKHDDGIVSVLLDYDNYWYDWKDEIKKVPSEYGDGHCYEYLFNHYLTTNYEELSYKLNYDSENGMFCVYCENMKDAKRVSSILSKLYNDETKMLKLIKETKKAYDINFDMDMYI